MILSKQIALAVIFGLLFVCLAAPPLCAQDEDEQVNIEDPEEREALFEQVESIDDLEEEAESLKKMGQMVPGTKEKTIPVFPFETPVEGADTMDPAEILSKAIEKLGGAEAYAGIQNVTWEMERRKYLKDGRLSFVERLKGFALPQKFYKIRLDYKTCIKSDMETFIDYREVMGDDGIFKFIDGNFVRTPLAEGLAGIILTRIYFQCFGIWEASTPDYDLKYLGQVSWNDGKTEEENVRSYHKILALFDDDRMSIRGSAIALYIDTDTFEFRRYVYEPLMKGARGIHRVRMVEYGERIQVGGIQMPGELLILDYWLGKLHGTHKIRFSKLVANSGLEDIGFELTNQ